jgi:GT2 family glycosyltransferase
VSEERRRPGPEPGKDGGEADLVRSARARVRRLERQIDVLEAAVASQRHALATIQGSKAWRIVMRLRHARDRVVERRPWLAHAYRAGVAAARRLLGRAPARPPDAGADAYAKWIEDHATPEAERAALRAEAARAGGPTFSVLVCAAAGDEEALRSCASAALAQHWRRWELIAALEGAAAGAFGGAGSDPRLRAAPPGEGGRAGLLARALALARGDFVLVLDAADELAPEALYELALAVEGCSEADLVYGDEDRRDGGGRRYDPLFKPGWSPDLLLSVDYIGRAAAYRRSVVLDTGWPGSAGAAVTTYDLALRVAERSRAVAHAPAIVLHAGRFPSPLDADAGAARAALQDALARRGVVGRVEPVRPELPRPVHAVRYALRASPLVSLVMPTRDKAPVLRACVESIASRSTWARRELLVVDNGSRRREALRYLRRLADRPGVRVLRDERPFNWSALNNAAARQAQGEVLLFVNNDLEVISPDWIEALLEHALRPEVGAVGARLLYPRGTLQHAGVVLGIGVAEHAFKHLPRDAPGRGGLPHAIRDVSAVTGACMMVRREVFERVGGFDEGFPVAYNDVDFCLRLRQAGLLVVYTPCAELYHHESVTRGPAHPPEDEARMWRRWRPVLVDDPYYSPHLSRDRADWSLA